LLTTHRVNSGFLESIRSLPKVKPKIDILSVAEIESLLKTKIEYRPWRGIDCDRLNAVYLTMIRFLSCTGCRYSEAADLTWQNVDLNDGYVVFEETKNREWRRVWISEPLIGELVLLKSEGRELVFTTMAGNRVPPQNFSSDLRDRAKRCNITKRIHPHLFRHTFASILLMNGVGITEVATIIGHKDIQTTFHNYAHLADLSLKRAVMRHPMISKHQPINDKLRAKIELIKAIQDDDPDFEYHYSEDPGEVAFRFRLNRGLLTR